MEHEEYEGMRAQLLKNFASTEMSVGLADLKGARGDDLMEPREYERLQAQFRTKRETKREP